VCKIHDIGFIPPPSNALKVSPEFHEPDNLRTFVPSPIKKCFLLFISRDCAGRLLEIQSSADCRKLSGMQKLERIGLLSDKLFR
jgi:hypothetical protein